MLLLCCRSIPRSFYSRSTVYIFYYLSKSTARVFTFIFESNRYNTSTMRISTLATAVLPLLSPRAAFAQNDDFVSRVLHEPLPELSAHDVPPTIKSLTLHQSPQSSLAAAIESVFSNLFPPNAPADRPVPSNFPGILTPHLPRTTTSSTSGRSFSTISVTTGLESQPSRSVSSSSDGSSADGEPTGILVPKSAPKAELNTSVSMPSAVPLSNGGAASSAGGAQMIVGAVAVAGGVASGLML